MDETVSSYYFPPELISEEQSLSRIRQRKKMGVDQIPSSPRLAHSEMSWDVDDFIPHEILSDTSGEADLYSLSSSSEEEEEEESYVDYLKRRIIRNKWGGYALDIRLWDDNKAPVVNIRDPKEIDLDDMEKRGILTDRIIAANSSFLTRSPENGRYIFGKCILRKMALVDVTILEFHRYLQYLDLAYNNIIDLTPLGGIRYLMYLDASHNRLKNVLKFTPPWFLTYVNLSFNYITKICDLSEFWSIVRLDLSHNAIEIINGLENLKHLQYLNLSYNLIECIENLDRLNIQELNLEANCINSFKSNMPGYGINSLSNLRIVMLAHNRLTSLKFFRNANGLRLVDLRFNKINDLLEVSHLKNVIYEVDLRGNPCTKWPSYRDVILHSMPGVKFVDGTEVSVAEKVSARTVFESPTTLVAARTIMKLILLEQLNAPRIDRHVVAYDQINPPLILLTGPSATRKIALAMHVERIIPKRVTYCKWCTTKTLTDDYEFRTYTYVPREEFNEMTRRGEFLAMQELLGHSYGFHTDQIITLVEEQKIGITQSDLHAAIQMCSTYTNAKPVLVIAKDEDVHRNWIREKFNVYTWIKDSVENLLAVKIGKHEETSSESTESVLSFIEEIIEDLMLTLTLPTYSMFLRPQGTGATMTDIIQESKMLLPKMVKTRSDVESEEKKHISFKEDDIPESMTKVQHLLTEQKEKQKHLKVIMDEKSNVIVEDIETIRKKQKTKLLYRRSILDTQVSDFAILEETNESLSSDESIESFYRRSIDTADSETLKAIYTELVIKSRRRYLFHHSTQPGFFYHVLLSDNYEKSFNNLIDFIYDLYVSHSFQKPRYSAEIKHFFKNTVPSTAESIVNEMKQNLSVSRVQQRKALRLHGVTSWKDLMPSQLSGDTQSFIT